MKFKVLLILVLSSLNILAASETSSSIELYSFIDLDSNGFGVSAKNIKLNHGEVNPNNCSTISENVEIITFAPGGILTNGRKLAITLETTNTGNDLALSEDPSQRIAHTLITKINNVKENAELKISGNVLKDEIEVTGINKKVSMNISSTVTPKDMIGKRNGTYVNSSVISIKLLAN